MKITHTDGLHNIMVDAEGRNRAEDTDAVMPLIDPKGIHVCTFEMVHEHINRRSVKPHMRTCWMVKVLPGTPGAQQVDTMSTIEMWLDVSFRTLNANSVDFDPSRKSKESLDLQEAIDKLREPRWSRRHTILTRSLKPKA